MIDPIAIRLPLQRPGTGLYESFYFRGTAPDGRTAFWLKHNLLRYRGERTVWVENALVLFDRGARATRTLYQKEELGPDAAARLFAEARDWDHLSFRFANGSFFEISRERLRGRIQAEDGDATWELTLERSDEVLYHLSRDRLYTLPLPKKKLLTRDIRLGFDGTLRGRDMSFAGRFLGMNGHNWGTEHAHAYAYANCAEFTGGEDAFFDGLSVKLALAGGRLKTPWLSLAALKVDGRWHRFDSLLAAMRHPVSALSDFRWSAQLTNATHRLQVEIDGGTPQNEPWVALHYQHPDRRVSVVKNTKFAALTLRLFERRATTPLRELTSGVCELETLLPSNLPRGPGYVGTP